VAYLTKAVLAVAFAAFATSASAQPVMPGAGGGGGQAAPAPAPAPGGSPGGSPGGLIATMNPQQLAQILNGLTIDNKPINMTVKTFDDKTGGVIIPFWGDQLYSGVLPIQCQPDGTGCKTLQFFANFGKQSSVDMNWMNSWNDYYLGVKVSVMDNGEMLFEYDLPLFSGVSADYIRNCTVFFKAVVDTAFTYKPGQKGG